MSTQYSHLAHEKFTLLWHDPIRLVSGVECKTCGTKGVAQHMNIAEAKSRGFVHTCTEAKEP